MKDLRENLPQNQGEFYVKYNQENYPEYGFLVNGTLITAFVNFGEQMPNMIYLPDLSDKIEKIDFDESQYDINEVVEATLVNRNHNYLRGQVRLAKDCFKGVKEATIVNLSNNSLYINEECFDNLSNIKFIVPKDCKLKNIKVTTDLKEENVFALIVDRNILNKIEDHINYSENAKWRIEDYNRKDYGNDAANIFIDKEVYIENGSFVFNKEQENETEREM